MAGPVVVCGVRFSKIPRHEGVRDSKQLSASRREKIAGWVRNNADAWAVVEIWPEVIDRINILEATRRAMRSIAQSLRGPDDVVVVDAVTLGKGFEDVLSPIKADQRFLSVAAASNVAKVHRDALMVELAQSYTVWEWERNKGYGTPGHLRGVTLHGLSILHRRSFRCGAAGGEDSVSRV